MGTTVRKGLIKNGWKKALAWECLFVHRQQGLLLFVYVDDIKMVGKKNNLQPMWKRWMKQIDLEKRTQSVDQVFLECTQRECKQKKKPRRRVQKICSDLWPPQELLRSCLVRENATPRLPLGPTNMEDHAKKCVGRYCELANKNIEQLFGVSTPCIDNHQFREEEIESVEELSKSCSCIVLKCLYLGRIGRLDILLSANHLARAVTE